jgi:hypothetical protein
MKSSPVRSGDSRKQAISIRMSRSDVRNIKRIAERLSARDSDVIRFAIKLMLAKLSPLQDPAVGGRSLVPLFVEWGPELMRHFDLDAATLSQILNEGTPEERRVDANDIQLIAMSGLQRSFVTARAASIPGSTKAASDSAERSGAGHSSGTSSISTPRSVRGEDPTGDVQTYLINKYLNFSTA